MHIIFLIINVIETIHLKFDLNNNPAITFNFGV